MKLKAIFPQLNKAVAGEISVSGISDDSRSTTKGDLFFIIEREHFDIFSVLKKVEPKIAAFVAKSSNKSKLEKIIKNKPIVYVDDVGKQFLKVVDKFYDFKSNDLKVIGVTGTNGKTTTSTLIYHILKGLGIKASLVGTLKCHIGSRIYKAENTTPGFLSLRKMMREAKESGSDFLVIEVSSHAIEQQRIRGINFHRCLFTNLGRDHLDYHLTVDSYFKTKKQLFLSNKKGVSLINIDDPFGVRLFRSLRGGLTYGTKEISDFKISNISLTRSGSRFDIENSNKIYSFKSQLCGMHNVYNVSAAFSLVASLDLPPEKILDQISSFSNVEGRLERIGESIFVDYAHTPDALNTVILALHNIGYEKVICVFGCGGDRDKGKRKLMGQVAAKHADFSFITSDNPRSEDPQLICRQIEEGFLDKNYKVILKRSRAIEEAINLLNKQRSSSSLKKKTCLLVAGKGHEDYQIIGSKKLPFKDSETVRRLIKK